MKPIFKPEYEFLQDTLKISLPPYCWRKGSKIYLNIGDTVPLIEFKAQLGKLVVKKNNIKAIHEDNSVTIVHKGKEHHIENLTLEEEYEKRKEYLDALIQEAIRETIAFMKKYPDYNYRISISGGKDSSFLLWIMKQVYEKLGKDFYTHVTPDVYNTTNDTADTYKHIKYELKPWVEPLMDMSKVTNSKTYIAEFNKHVKQFIHSPKKGWYKWLKEDKNWFLPSVNVRNCCSTYKEGQVKKVLSKNEHYVMFLGMRKHESQKRAFYDFDLDAAYLKNKGKATNLYAGWKRFCPIVNFRDEDVWLLLMHHSIRVNQMYSYGYSRCGCLICPYASDYTDILTSKYYPSLMKKWEYACERNYDNTDVANRLKWSREEWRLGKWKKGTSKERELLVCAKTKERVKQLAELKNIPIEIAEKYWDKNKCSCGKKLNPDEIAVNLKLFGRYDGVEDTRLFKCKNCICEDLKITKKEYQNMIYDFRSSGCNLF